MVFTVNPADFKYCGQIQIRKIVKSDNLKADLERALEPFAYKFGKIAKLVVLACGNSGRSEKTQTTTIGFLQYENNSSHYEAISYFEHVQPIIFNGKRLKFVASGFTNELFCSSWVDYSKQRHKACMGNVTLYPAPIIERPATLDKEALVTQTEPIASSITRKTTEPHRVQINSPIVTDRNAGKPSVTRDNAVKSHNYSSNKRIVCSECYKYCSWTDYPNHRCISIFSEKREVVEVANFLFSQINRKETSNLLLSIIRERCLGCNDQIYICDSSEVRILSCGHKMHKQCFAELARKSGIPVAKCIVEFVKCYSTGVYKKGKLTELTDDLESLSQRLVTCRECNRITPTQILKMETAVEKIERNEKIEEGDSSFDILLDFVDDLGGNGIGSESAAVMDNETMTIE
jgi:hypothetical protein